MMEIDSHGASSIRYLLCVVGTVGALIFASAASQNQTFKRIKERLGHADWNDGGRYALQVNQSQHPVLKDMPLTLRDVR